MLQKLQRIVMSAKIEKGKMKTHVIMHMARDTMPKHSHVLNLDMRNYNLSIKTRECIAKVFFTKITTASDNATTMC